MEYDYIPTDLLERNARQFEQQMHCHELNSEESKEGKVVTIARLFGAGADEIVARVREKLGWMVWDDQIVDFLARETHRDYQKRMFRALDEKAQSRVDEMVSVFCAEDPAETYFQLLPATVQTIAEKDAIIVGRAAHLFLPDALHILVMAPFESRVASVMKQSGLSQGEAEKEVKHQDRNRNRFLREMARQYEAAGNRKKEVPYDIELNAATLSTENAADLIVAAVRQKFGEE